MGANGFHGDTFTQVKCRSRLVIVNDMESVGLENVISLILFRDLEISTQ